MSLESKKCFKELKKEYKSAIKLITINALFFGVFSLVVAIQDFMITGDEDGFISLLLFVFIFLVIAPNMWKALFTKLYIRASLKG